MFKRPVPFLFLLLFCSNSFAEICPSVNEVKASTLKGWVAYDSDDGKPLSSLRIAKLKKAAQQFALAEWTAKGTIRCYYHDNNGADLAAYFAKENFMPKAASPYWYQVSGFMQCAAPNDKCEFLTKPIVAHQLAKTLTSHALTGKVSAAM